MLFTISPFFSCFGYVKAVLQLKVILSFWLTLIPLSLLFLFLYAGKNITHSCRGIWSGFKAVVLNVELRLITLKAMCWFHFLWKRLMISPSLFCQLKVHDSKKNSPKVEHLIFSPLFFYFLICLQVWLRSGQGKVSLLFFFHVGLKSASSQIHIDSFALFCKLKISHSFDADRNAVLCSPPSSWKQSPGRPAFPPFFFWTHLPDPGKKKAREIH